MQHQVVFLKKVNIGFVGSCCLCKGGGNACFRIAACLVNSGWCLACFRTILDIGFFKFSLFVDWSSAAQRHCHVLDFFQVVLCQARFTQITIATRCARSAHMRGGPARSVHALTMQFPIFWFLLAGAGLPVVVVVVVVVVVEVVEVEV